MTIQDWLDGRMGGAPEPLVARVHELLAGEAARDAAELPERAVAAADRAVARLLRDGCTTRAGALDLLAADALVTGAFEAAADEPERLRERARAAMRRLSRLAADHAAPGATA
jgi:hypothetical protein